MLTGLWPSPGDCQDYALSFDRQRNRRLLIIPALFDESNKLRHFTVEVMRRLDSGGVDSFLPDLPGMNESKSQLFRQTIAGWRDAVQSATFHFEATHLLAIRGGALVDPGHLPSLHYAAASGSGVLRTMARAQAMTAREAGTPVTLDELLKQGRQQGVSLAGYELGAQMVRDLSEAKASPPSHGTVGHGDVGGAGLWLRAEPDHDAAQADRLAVLLLERLR